MEVLCNFKRDRVLEYIALKRTVQAILLARSETGSIHQEQNFILKGKGVFHHDLNCMKHQSCYVGENLQRAYETSFTNLRD